MFISKKPDAPPGTISVSVGTGTQLVKITHSLIKQFIIKATTASTTFDVKLTDRDNNLVYHATDITGELNELPDIPTWGWLTVDIENSSVDEDFTYYFAFLERYD